MGQYENSVDSPPFARGDFVREKGGQAWAIGVVWDVHPRNAASVEVYYPVRGKTRMPREYKPEDLSVVPVNEVSEDLLRFRKSMER
jgi:hypothetical protein